MMFNSNTLNTFFHQHPMIPDGTILDGPKFELRTRIRTRTWDKSKLWTRGVSADLWLEFGLHDWILGQGQFNLDSTLISFVYDMPKKTWRSAANESDLETDWALWQLWRINRCHYCIINVVTIGIFNNFMKVRKGQDPIWHRSYRDVSMRKMFDLKFWVYRVIWLSQIVKFLNSRSSPGRNFDCTSVKNHNCHCSGLTLKPDRPLDFKVFFPDLRWGHWYRSHALQKLQVKISNWRQPGDATIFHHQSL